MEQIPSFNKKQEEVRKEEKSKPTWFKKTVLGAVGTGMAMGAFAKNQETPSDAEILRDNNKKKIENIDISQPKIESGADSIDLNDDMYLYKKYIKKYGEIDEKKKERLLELNKYCPKGTPEEEINYYLSSNKLYKDYLKRVKDYFERWRQSREFAEIYKKRIQTLKSYSEGVNSEYFSESFILQPNYKDSSIGVSDEYFINTYIPVIKRISEMYQKNKEVNQKFFNNHENKITKILTEEDIEDLKKRYNNVYDSLSDHQLVYYTDWKKTDPIAKFTKPVWEEDESYSTPKGEVLNEIYDLMYTGKDILFQEILNSPIPKTLDEGYSIIEIGNILDIELSDAKLKYFFENIKDKDGKIAEKSTYKIYFKDKKQKTRCLEVVKDGMNFSFIIDGDLIRYNNTIKYRNNAIVFNRGYGSIFHTNINNTFFTENNVSLNPEEKKFFSDSKKAFEEKEKQIQRIYEKESITEKIESKEIASISSEDVPSDNLSLMKTKEGILESIKNKSPKVSSSGADISDDLAIVRQNMENLEKLKRKEVFKVYSKNNADMSLMKIKEKEIDIGGLVLNIINQNFLPIDATDSLGHFSNRIINEGLNNNNYTIELKDSLIFSKDVGLYLEGKGDFDLILKGDNDKELIIGHVNLGKGAFIYDLPNNFKLKELDIFTTKPIILNKAIPCQKINDKDGKIIPIPVDSDFESEDNDGSDGVVLNNKKRDSNYYATSEELNK